MRRTGAAAEILTTNYVLVETAALIQRRLGIEATRAFAESIVPLLAIEWIDPEVHAGAVSTLPAANRRDLTCSGLNAFRERRSITVSEEAVSRYDTPQ